MDLRIERKWKKDTYTIGNLYYKENNSDEWKFICNTLEDKDRGLDCMMSEEEIKAKKVYAQTAIPTGKYRVFLKQVSPRFQYSSWAKPYEGRVPRIMNVKGFEGVLIHCLTEDTEILTENGWQNYNQFIENEAEYCFSLNTETGKLEKTKINFLVNQEYNGLLYCNTGKRINYEVTDKHKMWVGSLTHEGKIKFDFRTADNLNKQSYFLTCGVKSDGEVIDSKKKILYRILMATVADGYILNWSDVSSQVRFHLKKDRKIERLKSLLEEIGSDYKIYIDGEQKTHIIVSKWLSELLTEILNPTRELNCKKVIPNEILNLKSDDLKDLLLEYLFWDGRYENYLKNNKNIILCGVQTWNLDMLQAMAALCGFRSYLKDDKGCLDLVLYEGQERVVPESESYSTKEFSGNVWCLNNDNHTLIIRKNGRTMIIGNCGNYAGKETFLKKIQIPQGKPVYDHPEYVKGGAAFKNTYGIDLPTGKYSIKIVDGAYEVYTVKDDTEGCVLLGENKVKGGVINSQLCFHKFMDIVKHDEDGMLGLEII